MSESYPFPALRARIAQLAAEGRDAEREAASWQLAELTMRGPVGFNPGRRLAVSCPSIGLPPLPRLRYQMIEAG